MKNVDKVVENRIEKHLDLVEHNKTYYTEAEVLNTSEVLPATIDGKKKIQIFDMLVRICIIL